MSPDQIMREALRDIYDLAGWHSDDDADFSNENPEDQVAHINGLIRRICGETLAKERVQREIEHRAAALLAAREPGGSDTS